MDNIFVEIGNILKKVFVVFTVIQLNKLIKTQDSSYYNKNMKKSYFPKNCDFH